MVVVVAVSGAHAGDLAAGAAGSDSYVGNLAVMNDLEPLTVSSPKRDRFVSARPSAAFAGEVADTQLRPSVPAADRSRSLFGGSDVFAISKGVMPLLVSDMAPMFSPLSRPLSASPVGERPSLPLMNRNPLTK